MCNGCFALAEAESRLDQLTEAQRFEVMAHGKEDSLILIKQGAEAVSC